MGFGLSLLLACSGPAAPDAPEPAATPSAEPSPGTPAPPPLAVRLVPPPVRDEFRFEAESAGLVTLLLDAGLSELGGVVVGVDGSARSPGVERVLGGAALEPWTASVTLGTDPRSLDVTLELCAPGGLRCEATSATGTRDAPEGAMPVLLRWAADRLGRAPTSGAEGQWSIPVSKDPYAVLVCGRAGATFYGLLPAVPEESEGEPADAIAKAVRIDPAMALAQWLLARRYAARGKWSHAALHFTAAREGRPFQPVFLADQAAALGRDGKALAAADAWDALAALAPRDARFGLSRAHALLAADRLTDADAALAELFRDWPVDAGVAEARVRLADARGEEAHTDDLLAHWAATDKTAIEPVRRRILLRVRAGSFEDAWAMLPELEARGAHALAAELRVPIGVAVARWDEAAGAAERLGQPGVASRIRARRDLGRTPGRLPAGSLDWDPSPEAAILLARTALAADDPARAHDHAKEGLEAARWDPDVLALAVDVAVALRDDRLAERYGADLLAVEPRDPVVVAAGR